MVRAVYIYSEWGVLVLEKGENIIVGHGECVGFTRMFEMAGRM